MYIYINHYAHDPHTGTWASGKKSGYGELFYANGDKFSGNWADDKVRRQVFLSQSSCRLSNKL
ncbi:hypothetical protein EON63_20485 [archaeon]|nr:MAG: hypothetical protein EON63_20485 [archaeon]